MWKYQWANQQKNIKFWHWAALRCSAPKGECNPHRPTHTLTLWHCCCFSTEPETSKSSGLRVLLVPIQTAWGGLPPVSRWCNLFKGRGPSTEFCTLSSNLSWICLSTSKHTAKGAGIRPVSYLTQINLEHKYKKKPRINSETQTNLWPLGLKWRCSLHCPNFLPKNLKERLKNTQCQKNTVRRDVANLGIDLYFHEEWEA